MTRARLEELSETDKIYDSKENQEVFITKVYCTTRINGLQVEYLRKSYYGNYREKKYYSRKELLTDRFSPVDVNCHYTDYCCHCKHLTETRLPNDIYGREHYKEDCELCFECDFIPTENFVDSELKNLNEEE